MVLNALLLAGYRIIDSVRKASHQNHIVDGTIRQTATVGHAVVLATAGVRVESTIQPALPRKCSPNSRSAPRPYRRFLAPIATDAAGVATQ